MASAPSDRGIPSSISTLLHSTFPLSRASRVTVASDPSEVPPRAGKGATLCLMDPPREGAADWLDWIESKEDLETILYVSCDPMTQVRDVASLVEHGYEIRKIYGYDMFPNTGHIETLAVLVRGGKRK